LFNLLGVFGRLRFVAIVVLLFLLHWFGCGLQLWVTLEFLVV
jgi:hypothetical protein